MAESKGIKTQISLIDNMSGVISRINNNLGVMMTTMRNVDTATNEGFDSNIINAFESAIQDSQVACQELNNQLDGINNQSFDKLTQGSLVFANVMGNIITSAGRMAVNAISQTISSSVEAYNIQRNAETQLMSVLRNTSDDAVASFDRVLAKAKEIQSNGIYGDEGMIAAGAEFATYFSDTDAIESMMDTLSDYAMGMSGGGALDNKALVDYATNIAKMTTGAYDAMTKKGFEVTETQKHILKGTATQAELVAELGENYNSMTDDMQKATVINSIIAESWDGLYESMSDTPEGKIISLANAWGDLKEEMGGQIQMGLQAINNVLEENWQTIEIVVHAFSDAIQLILVGASKVIDVVIGIAQGIIDNWSMIEPILVGVAAALALVAVKSMAVAAANLINMVVSAWPLILIAGIIALIGYLGKFLGAAETTLGGILGMLNVIKTAFMNTIYFAQSLFWGLLATATEVIAGIAEKLNLLPFVNIDTTGLTNAAEEFRSKQEAAQGNIKTMDEAYREGAAYGDQLVGNITSGIDSILNPALGQDSILAQNTGAIASSTAGIEDTLNTDNEEMAYLKDLAEQETINRFTTAEIKVDMGGVSQNISKDTDADSVIDYLVKGVEEGMQSVAEGVYA